MGSGQHVCDAAQCRLSAFQRKRQRGSALLCGYELLLHDESLPQQRLYIHSNYTFLDRFDPHTEGYFSGQGELTGRFFLTTNFVSDTHTLKLTDYSERGKGSTNMKFNLAKNTMGA